MSSNSKVRENVYVREQGWLNEGDAWWLKYMQMDE
jgi:hypothetical protein